MNNTTNTTSTADDGMCTFMATEAECNGTMSTHFITATASIVACVWMYFYMKYIRNREKEGTQNCSTELLIQHLAIAVGLSAFHYTWGNYILAYEAQNDHRISAAVVFCRIGAWFDLFTSWLANCWIVTIANYTCWIKLEQRSPLGVDYVRNVWKNSLITALSFSLFPFFSDDYGPAGMWCWIRIDGKHFISGLIMQLVLYYASSLLVFIAMGTYLIYSYCKVYQQRKVMRDRTPGANEHLDCDFITLLPLPWIFFVCFLGALVNRVRLMIEEDDRSVTNTIFWVLVAILPESPGLIFAVWITLWYKLQKLKCCSSGPEKSRLLSSQVQA